MKMKLPPKKTLPKSLVQIVLMAIALIATIYSATAGPGDLNVVNSSIAVTINDAPAAAPFAVFPGDRIAVTFDFTNEFTETLGHIELTLSESGSSEIDDLPITHSCSGADCNDGFWALTAGETETDSFSFTVPFDISSSVTSFDVDIEAAYDNEWGVFTDTATISFPITREEHAIEIIDDSIVVDAVGSACDNIIDLEFEIVNTGNRTFTPEYLIHELEGATFDRFRGEFRTYAGGGIPAIFLNDELTPIGAGVRRTETVRIDLSELPDDDYDIYLYIVNPYFDAAGSFIGDAHVEMDVPVVACPEFDSFDPEEVTRTIREDETVTLRVVTDGPTDPIVWEVDGEVEERDTAIFLIDGSVHVPGTTLDVRAFVDADGDGDNDGDSHEWEVTVSNVPEAGGFSHSLPAGISLDQLARVDDFRVSNAFGRIEFDDAIDLSGVRDLGDAFFIGDGIIAVDTDDFAGLDAPATITFFTTFTSPRIFTTSDFDSDFSPEADDLCSEADGCRIVSTAAGSFIFEVDGFSTYRVLDERPASVRITDILFDDVDRGGVLSTTVTISNEGTLEALSGLTAELVSVPARYNATLSGAVPASLGALGSFALTLDITVPADEASGSHTIGNVLVSSINEEGITLTATSPIILNPHSLLSIERIEIDGSASGELLLDQPTDIEVRVRNDYTSDFEDVHVEITIEDVDGDDLEKDCSDFDLDVGDSDDCKVSFNFHREDNIDKNSYRVTVRVEAEAADGTAHTTEETITVDVKRENHQVIIRQASLGTSVVQCLRQTNLQVTIENVGENDEDNVEIRVFSAAVDIDQRRTGIRIDEFDQSDNDYRATFALDLGGAPPATYTITVEAYRDGRLDDSEDLTLAVQACGTSGTATQTSSVTAGSRLLDALQQRLQPGQTAEDVPTTTLSFREKGSYLVLLGVLTVLALIAVVLMAVIGMKR